MGGRYHHICPGCGENQGRRWVKCQRHMQTCCPDLLEGARAVDCRIERQDPPQPERLPNVYKCPGCGAAHGKWSNCLTHMRSCEPHMRLYGSNRVTRQQCLASYEETVEYVAMSGGGGATRRVATNPGPAPRNDRPGVDEAFYYYHPTAAEEERAAAAAFGTRMRGDWDGMSVGGGATRRVATTPGPAPRNDRPGVDEAFYYYHPTAATAEERAAAAAFGARMRGDCDGGIERTSSINSEEKKEKRNEVGVVGAMVGESLGNVSTLAGGVSPGSESAGMNADADCMRRGPIAGSGSEQVGLDPVQEIGWSLFHAQIKSPSR